MRPHIIRFTRAPLLVALVPLVALVAHVAFVAFVALATVPAFSAEQKPLHRGARQKAVALCARGQHVLEQGVLDEASAAFEEALRVAPGFPPAHVGLGHVALRRGDAEGALREYELARDTTLRAAMKRDAEALRLRIASRRQADALHDLVTGLTRSAVDHSESMESLYVDFDAQYADELRKLESGGEADLRETAQLFFFMGSPQFRLQRYHDAYASWQLSAKLDPHFGPVYVNLSVVCFKLGRLVESRAYLAKAEELHVPFDPQFKQELEQELARWRHDAGPS